MKHLAHVLLQASGRGHAGAELYMSCKERFSFCSWHSWQLQDTAKVLHKEYLQLMQLTWLTMLGCG